MLTRLEVDGFKNLLGFGVDFGPFNCIAGPNGVGKSNIFDAIRFLSLLTDHTLMDAAILASRSASHSDGDYRDLFWNGYKAVGQLPLPRFRIAAEMIVPAKVQDDFGRPAKATSTYLRYEVEIGYEAPDQRANFGRLLLRSESLRPMSPTSLRLPSNAVPLQEALVDTRQQRPLISTTQGTDGLPEIHIHRDSRPTHPHQPIPAYRTSHTIVGTANSSTTPTILAARREMQGWRLLALDPQLMREANRFIPKPHLTSRGDHLHATLHHIARTATTRGEAPDQVLARVAGRLAEFVPAHQVTVDTDELRQRLMIEVQERGGLTLPAHALSDGTLRALALIVLSEDPEMQGLLCIEEPENGIHPAKMEAMVRLLKDIAVDPEFAIEPDNPLRQVIIATHSPVLVQLLQPDELLLATPVIVDGPQGQPVSTVRAKALIDTWRCQDRADCVGQGAILAYLTAPENASLHLSLDL